tara:strand:+ start:62 stop:805 length:744 start_codon:yes stop_codon:yes gene_type:complete
MILYLLILSLFYVNSSEIPFNSYCFNSSYEEAHIINKNFTKCTSEITYITDITTTDSYAKVYFSLISPYNSSCEYSKCNSKFRAGYDYTVFKSCIDDNYIIDDNSSNIEGIIIDQEANKTHRYYIIINHLPHTYCSYKLIKGAIYSNHNAYCTPLMKLETEEDYIYCDLPVGWPESATIIIISLVSIISLLVGVIIIIRKRRTFQLKKMYDNVSVQTPYTGEIESNTNYIKLYDNVNKKTISEELNH